MNRPIRALAVGCLLLFAMLLINANYVQVIKANDLNDAAANKRARDAECSRERGPILVDGEPVARQRAEQRQPAVPAPLHATGRLYANLTGFFSCIYGTSGDREHRELDSLRQRRAAVRQPGDRPGRQRPAQGRQRLPRRSTPKAQQAALDGFAGPPAQYGPTKGAVVALDPTTGAILAMVTQPSYNPNLIASHDADAGQAGLRAARERARRPRTSTVPPSRSTRPARRSSWSPRRPR